MHSTDVAEGERATRPASQRQVFLGWIVSVMRGKKFTAGFGILIAAGLLTGFQTEALRANWKYAGGAPSGKESGSPLAFFDSENIRYLPNGDVQVWVKEIGADDIERIVDRDKKVMDQAAEKVAKSYYPPYFLSGRGSNPGDDTYIAMITWEEAANHADIAARVKRLYEINCREGTIQTISSVTYRTDGTATFTSDFDRWSPIDPGSVGDALRRLLCK